MAARSGLNALIIQMTAFAQIMDIWRPGRSMEDHLNLVVPNHWLTCPKGVH